MEEGGVVQEYLGVALASGGEDQYHLVLWLCVKIHPLHMT